MNGLDPEGNNVKTISGQVNYDIPVLSSFALSFDGITRQDFILHILLMMKLY